MRTGIDVFFSALVAMKLNLELATLKQGSYRFSTDKSIGKFLENLDVQKVIRMYTALYYSPNIEVESKEIDILLYVQNMYKVIQEGRLLFTDSCILAELDKISANVLNLIYDLRYKQ